jgi:hypothetical protein
MSATAEHRPPWFLWPFVALWRLLAAIVGLTGRLVAIVLGLVLLIVGAVLTALIVTAPIGLPLALFGLLLVVKGLW